jgi:hypothetical protein
MTVIIHLQRYQPEALHLMLRNTRDLRLHAEAQHHCCVDTWSAELSL